MTPEEVKETVQQLIDAHKDLKPADLARLVQQHFRDSPILGYLILDYVGAWPADTQEPEHAE